MNESYEQIVKEIKKSVERGEKMRRKKQKSKAKCKLEKKICENKKVRHKPYMCRGTERPTCQNRHLPSEAPEHFIDCSLILLDSFILNLHLPVRLGVRLNKSTSIGSESSSGQRIHERDKIYNHRLTVGWRVETRAPTGQ